MNPRWPALFELMLTPSLKIDDAHGLLASRGLVVNGIGSLDTACAWRDGGLGGVSSTYIAMLKTTRPNSVFTVGAALSQALVEPSCPPPVTIIKPEPEDKHDCKVDPKKLADQALASIGLVRSEQNLVESLLKLIKDGRVPGVTIESIRSAVMNNVGLPPNPVRVAFNAGAVLLDRKILPAALKSVHEPLPPPKPHSQVGKDSQAVGGALFDLLVAGMGYASAFAC